MKKQPINIDQQKVNELAIAKQQSKAERSRMDKKLVFFMNNNPHEQKKTKCFICEKESIGGTAFYDKHRQKVLWFCGDECKRMHQGNNERNIINISVGKCGRV